MTSLSQDAPLPEGETPDLEGPSAGGTASPAPAAPGRRDAPEHAAARQGRLAGLGRSPLLRRITGYSAGSVIAAFLSELCFAAAFGWGHTDTFVASLAGFVGGAVPNYILNRRWAWNDRRGRSRRNEILLYAAVTIASLAASTAVTSAAERWARHLTQAQSLRVVLVAAAYLAVSAVFFAGKFVVYELVVFTKGPGEGGGSSGRPAEASTTS